MYTQLKHTTRIQQTRTDNSCVTVLGSVPSLPVLNDLTILLNLPLFWFYQSKDSFLAFFLVTFTCLLLFTGLNITVLSRCVSVSLGADVIGDKQSRHGRVRRLFSTRVLPVEH